MLAFVAFLVEFVRGRGETKSFRPLIGWLTALLGVVAAAVAIVTLYARHLLPWSRDGMLLGSALLVAVLVAVVEICTALLTPSGDLAVLREIAWCGRSVCTARCSRQRVCAR
jgi:hypothetical protein